MYDSILNIVLLQNYPVLLSIMVLKTIVLDQVMHFTSICLFIYQPTLLILVFYCLWYTFMQKLFKFHKQFNIVQGRVKKYSEFIMYFMYNNPWQMQSIISQNNHPFFPVHIV